jgi:hypothetical protein
MEFDHNTIRAALENERLILRCPACGATEWRLGAVFVLPLLDRPGELGPVTAEHQKTGEGQEDELTMHGAAVVPRACTGCGHMQLFDVPSLLQHENT